MTLDWPWKVLFAVVGNASFTRRLSVLPLVVGGEVVRLSEPRSWLPVLLKVTARWIGSLGTRAVAATENRFAAPGWPNSTFTVPAVTEALAEVVEVNEP